MRIRRRGIERIRGRRKARERETVLTRKTEETEKGIHS